MAIDMGDINNAAAWSGLIIGLLAAAKAFGLEALKGVISDRLEKMRIESAVNLEHLKAKFNRDIERFKGFHSAIAKDEVATYKELWGAVSIALVALNRISDDINPWTLADLYGVSRAEIEDYECDRAIELKNRYIEETVDDFQSKINAADGIAYASRPFISTDVWNETTSLLSFLSEVWLNLKFGNDSRPISELLETARIEVEGKVDRVSSIITKTIRD
ncbi:hypothetical protein [Pseudomonas sp. EL_65y_Pfl2_R96]|uniref:hypothetical protein n=1 Tax=Pseudomonas sp. EL_65y_Pfl2_R96 TaxID=3088699 RepID=UPI0030DC3173